jgi:Zn-dependent peptidase ImmA (M78 family)
LKKPDDSSLGADQYARVRAEARRALKQAGAFGRFPTPVDDIMDAAKVEEVFENVLDESFLAKMRKKAGKALKSALSKVLGLFDANQRLVIVDRTLYAVKQTFIRLHETGHGFMRWQRDLYAVVEDCEQTLDPEVADLFDREANVFASEVLFQIDSFSEEAEGHTFGILTPVRIGKKYGASIYASVRQYVSKNHRACAVLVLDPPVIVDGDGFRASLRRFVPSPRFTELFGRPEWQPYFTPDDSIGAMVPLGSRKMTGKRTLALVDRNGGRHECIAEAFTQKHQVFVLIQAVQTMTKSLIVLP